MYNPEKSSRKNPSEQTSMDLQELTLPESHENPLMDAFLDASHDAIGLTPAQLRLLGALAD
jgi:hypothetical protein